ncbi:MULTISPECIES: outer membrane-stress sensor serine endopeptidase DegS [unclassified Avibacterium]|uniref:outer membrane-stress sensor serine endopeptidase DegS n=1 Tax=unclassified Avibacterium TaxID=2685287 RepID=UPI002025DE1D|nr:MULTISPECIES: outer membrane-stress sensor serine endopeptidase DegS [unclassified Avibacterium]MCW9698351.1 outer membrane-stress sensor serine endopeptidase DegS [Avibacterium sp. 20-129]MCW9732068.1 outer membrane-stress sensor serine endopeptidase DegS [Avibacterium sp. 20-15]URL02813.1 outer membrane-stress sensor serine endopeptidase DegS [Avibacterium sp. 20-126]URL04247.1 outer membrane-stress sensor serine endopeptidase DegS [Avibacterium sp. 20-132]
MLRKLIQSIIIGLLAAGAILLISPFLKQDQPLFQKAILSFKDAVRVASPAVVNVYSQSFTSMSGQPQITNLGSGVIMVKDGHILTNKHVIQNADQIVVAMQNGRIFEASLIGSDNLTDLAVLKIRADNLPTIPNTKRKLHVGDVVLAIGNPYNLGQSVSQGIISALGRNAVGDYIGRQNFIQTDASINRGNSGGALINSLGELVGISTLSIGKNANEIAEGLNFAIPIDLANDVMKKIIRDGRVIRGFLGIQTDVLLSDETSSKGIEITNVKENSPAAKAGLQAGDIMLQFGDIKAESPAQMMNVISNTRPNTTVNMVISRLGKVMTLPVTIEEYTEN